MLGSWFGLKVWSRLVLLFIIIIILIIIIIIIIIIKNIMKRKVTDVTASPTFRNFVPKLLET